VKRSGFFFSRVRRNGIEWERVKGGEGKNYLYQGLKRSGRQQKRVTKSGKRVTKSGKK